MSTASKAGLAALVVLATGAGAYYWLQAKAARSPEVMFPSEAAPAADSVGSPRTHEPPTSSSPASKLPTAETAPAPVSPIRTGEVLEFTANVAKLTNVAKLRLQVAGQKLLAGREVWHLQAFAHTENPLRMVFMLDDQFDSYSDAKSLASLQYEMYLNERGEKLNSVQRLTTGARDPAPAQATATVVKAGTRDPLGFMQFLRTVDWSRTPEVRCPVYDGRKLYDVRAQLAAKETSVSVPAGAYQASRIAIHVFDRGQEMKDASFSLYLANTSERTPVLLEAVMPFADARIELLKVR